jgi:hypothetical protein
MKRFRWVSKTDALMQELVYCLAQLQVKWHSLRTGFATLDPKLSRCCGDFSQSLLWRSLPLSNGPFPACCALPYNSFSNIRLTYTTP